MGHRAGIAAVAGLAALVVASPAAAQEDAREKRLVAAVGPSVVQLVEKDRDRTGRQGTGFFVREDGVVATNHHVIAGADYPMFAVLRDGRSVRVLGVLSDDPVHDVALVRVEGSGYPALPVAPLESIHDGQRIMLVGSPMGFGGSVFFGTLSAIRSEMPDEWKKRNARVGNLTQGPFVQHSIAAGPGSSGSPLLDMDGRVVGVNHSGVEGVEIGFGAHASLLKDLMARTDYAAKPTPIGPDVKKNLLVSGGVLGGAAALGLGVWLFVRWRGRARDDDDDDDEEGEEGEPTVH